MATIYPNKKGSKTVSYKLRAFLGKDEKGKQIFKCKTWKVPEGYSEKKALKEAQIQADLFEKELRKDISLKKETLNKTKDKRLLKDYIEEIWISELTNQDYRPTTIEFKKSIGKTIADSALGRKPLSKIAKNDIETFFEKSKLQKSQKTLRHYRSTLNLIFKDAIKRGFIFVNPLNDVDPLPLKKKAVDAFTKDEANEFLAKIENKPLRLRLIYILILTTGLRRGECFGLRWCDIDLASKVLVVSQNVTYAGKRINIGKVKTSTGENRKIPIIDSVLDLMLQFQKEEKERYTELKKTDYLFHDENSPSIPQNPQYLTKRMSKDLKKIGSLPNMSPHDLRHSCASILIQTGADVKSVQDILGHADASTTLNYYVKGDINRMREATNNAFNFKTDNKGESKDGT